MGFLTQKQQHIKLVQSWATSPIDFVNDALCVELITNQQREALVLLGRYVTVKMKLSRGEEVSEEERLLARKIGISIMSGRGTGKDAFLAWCIIWFLCCFPHSLVPCTAPSAHQLRDVLWKEINKWLRQSKVKDWLVWQTDKVYFRESEGKEWFAVGRTANPKSSIDEQTETLSGFHEEYMMVGIDEASGIPEAVFTPLEGTMTGKVNFMMLIFNPTRSSGFAIDSQFNGRNRWICLQWNAEDSEIVSRESIEDKAAKYGKESNYYRINVSGLPPVADSDTLIPWDWVIEAVERDTILPMDTDEMVFGFDVGAGGDSSIIIRRTGNFVEEIHSNDSPDSEVLTNWALGLIFKYEPKMVFVDSIGWGWGVAGNLKERCRSEIISVNVHESASEDNRFKRLRDELWWRLRERFEKKDIKIPNDDELIAQLTTIKYDEKDGKVKVEGKRELRSRGIESPNKADGLMMTEYYPSYTIRQMFKPGTRTKWRGRQSNWKLT